ncbi:AAA family ATPase [Streptomyces sp. H27-C3]|uniref:AAA family ATPase n=1 Tax=Streptomyces sp. H27-C3 TaxID=3046305 RepID=UPI0024BBA31A|nr:AAA family ATPase [Streptomyces sp. H27-C3]MDJ0461565.1 AAA family ATPase [Streptomyces sp. H27-C3]
MGSRPVLFVITGPPAAGKTSWIQSHAKAADIVIDLDRITVALTGPGAPQWNHDPLTQRVAQRARYAAIDEATQHLDKLDCYLIHTMPNAKARAKYKRLAARIIVVDPGRDIVMQRIDAMRAPEMKRVATRWYNSRRGQSRTAMPQASRPW